jgi:cytochrome b6-f complex iron-sulfur subunit
MSKSAETPAGHPDAGVAPRRSFLNWLWGVLGLGVLAQGTWLLFSFLQPRRRKTLSGEFGTVISAGDVDGFVRSTVTAFPRGRFYLVRLEDGGFLAVSRECTHLGCTVPWDAEAKIFRCPCHASVFDIRGDAVHAPASRALDLFAVEIENNVLFVDTGQRTRRSAFQPSQAVYPTLT